MNSIQEVFGRSLSKDPANLNKPKESSPAAGIFTESLQAALADMEKTETAQQPSDAPAGLHGNDLRALQQVTAAVDEALKALDHLVEMKRLLLASVGKTEQDIPA